jgi:hypothetical protein
MREVHWKSLVELPHETFFEGADGEMTKLAEAKKEHSDLTAAIR